MTEDIIKLAREAGFVEYELEDYTSSGYDIRYERLVELARADEREAAEERVTDLFERLEAPYLPDIIKTIRARGNDAA